MSEQEKHLGEQGLSSSFIWKLIITFIYAILFVSAFVAR